MLPTLSGLDISQLLPVEYSYLLCIFLMTLIIQMKQHQAYHISWLIQKTRQPDSTSFRTVAFSTPLEASVTIIDFLNLSCCVNYQNRIYALGLNDCVAITKLFAFYQAFKRLARDVDRFQRTQQMLCFLHYQCSPPMQ